MVVFMGDINVSRVLGLKKVGVEWEAFARRVCDYPVEKSAFETGGRQCPRLVPRGEGRRQGCQRRRCLVSETG